MLKYEQEPLQTTPYRKSYNHNYTGNSILDKARGSWPNILKSLGIDTSYLKNKHGPCPVCGGKDRFRFDDKEGRGTFICTQCGAGDGIKLLRLYRGWRWSEAINAIAELMGVQSLKCELFKSKLITATRSINLQQEHHVDLKKLERLKKMLDRAVPIVIGDPVERYFSSRGIKLCAFPSELYYHSRLPYYENKELLGYFPAMLAKVKNEKSQVVTLHRTYLGDGCKADVLKLKKLMPSVWPGASIGAAIKLYEPIDGKLALAEGIETAISFNIATQLPVWATVSALGMEKVILPPYITEVVIAADNDKSGCGQKAAANLKKRLLAEGRSVMCVMPPTVGHDFNDVLLKVGV